MARLDGKKKSALPLLIGLALLALLLVGGYFVYQNRGADAVAVQPGNVTVTDNQPGNLVSNGADAERSGNTVTVGSENGAASDSAVGNAADATANDATSNDAGANATGTAPSSDTPVASGDATNIPPVVVNGGAVQGETSSGAEPGGAAKSGAAKDVVRERSKTIKNNKTGTTVTYQKKEHSDGSVSHTKSTTP